MTRRADWRRPTDEPRRGLAVLRVTVLDALALPSVNQPLLIGAMVLWAVSVFGALFSGAFILTLAIIVSMFAFVRVVAWFEKRAFRRSREKWDGLLPAPLPEGTFPVHFAIRYRGALTALDLAAASFVDGWLHIEGRRTSFAIRTGEGRAEWRGDRLRIEFSDGQRIALWHKEPPGSIGTQFYFASQSKRTVAIGAPSDGNAARFRHAARLWIADREHPEGESILPPLGTYPTVRTTLRAGTLASGLVALTLYALAGRLGGSAWTLPTALLGGLAVLLFAGAVRTCVRQNDADRRILERGRPVR